MEGGNSLRKTIFIPVVIVLVALTAFGLGRLSALEGQKGELGIHQPGEAVQ